MGGEFLGELEQMILLAVVRLGPDAYGWAVGEELARVVGRRVSSGALYTTLDRLEGKGLLSARAGDPRPERGGRPRRYLTVTPKGLEALRAGREALSRLWSGIDPEPRGAR